MCAGDRGGDGPARVPGCRDAGGGQPQDRPAADTPAPYCATAESSGWLDQSPPFCPFAGDGVCGSGCPDNRERVCVNGLPGEGDF